MVRPVRRTSRRRNRCASGWPLNTGRRPDHQERGVGTRGASRGTADCRQRRRWTWWYVLSATHATISVPGCQPDKHANDQRATIEKVFPDFDDAQTLNQLIDDDSFRDSFIN